ncbi:DUF2142 domain-containing protein [Geitlerinema sp. PCC 9228]|uniref:DUF2142 domain-containing protein n=1 Tax=Geitlerinema sp. PCC 9228 TaxID=111611 RepID=UPI000A076CB5|nr:DUF2142 domain-containing protein [Geitlerinema sp. PCC 9228]
MQRSNLRSFSWTKFYRQPEHAFLILSLVFGTIFLLVVPPFQIPDEPAHFLRTYQVSELNFIPEKQWMSSRKGVYTGGMLPKSLPYCFASWSELNFHPERKATLERFRESWQIPLQPSQKTFLGFSNTALYSPVPYLPQSIGITLGKFFHAPPLLLMYLGRVFAWMAATGITFWAIVRLPLMKWAFVFLALTPMAVFLRSSLSADSILLALAFLLVATCWHYAFRSQKLTAWNLAELTILGMAVSLCKQVYFPLIFLFFLIPRHKLGNTKRYFGAAGIVIIAVFVVAFIWSSIANSVFTPARGDIPIDPAKQLTFIVENPMEFVGMVWKDFDEDVDFYLHQIVGILGWLDTPLPGFLWIPYIVALLGGALASDRAQFFIHWWQKVGTFFVIIGIFFLVYVSMFFAWTAVGGEEIKGVQGRYFFPIFPLVLFLLANRRWQLPIADRIWQPAAVLYLIFVLSSSVVILFHRYYPI